MAGKRLKMSPTKRDPGGVLVGAEPIAPFAILRLPLADGILYATTGAGVRVSGGSSPNPLTWKVPMNKLALLPLVVLVACTTPPLEPFSLTGSCQQTCAQARWSCGTQGAHAANRCFSSCFGSSCYYCDRNGDSVEAVCLNDVEAVCGSASSGCADNDFRAQVGGHDLALEEQCIEFMTACASPEEATACGHFARVEDPTTVTAYACAIENGCNADACPAPAPDGVLARQYMTGIEGCGWVSSIGEPELAESLGWLREDVRGSLRDCLTMSCENGRVQCATAWIQAVFP